MRRFSIPARSRMRRHESCRWAMCLPRLRPGNTQGLPSVRWTAAPRPTSSPQGQPQQQKRTIHVRQKPAKYTCWRQANTPRERNRCHAKASWAPPISARLPPLAEVSENRQEAVRESVRLQGVAHPGPHLAVGGATRGLPLLSRTPTSGALAAGMRDWPGDSTLRWLGVPLVSGRPAGRLPRRQQTPPVSHRYARRAPAQARGAPVASSP